MISYDYEIQSMNSHSGLTEIALSKLETKLSIQKGSSTLNLSDCFIGDEGCLLLSSHIQQNPNIQTLELRGNSISGEGLRHLSAAFRSQSTIKSLSLEWNNLGDSISAFLESLSLSPSIHSLDLRNNRITSEGAGHIGRFLETNTSIVRIDLRWNELGTLGGKRLLQALNKCRSLKTLELNGNKICEDVLLQIEEALTGQKEKTFEIQTYESRFNEEEIINSSRKSPSRSHVSYNDDLYSKFEAQMIQNSRNSAKINELEILLQQETRKTQDLKNEFYKDLEAEKVRRSFAEESLMLFKEESLQRDTDSQRLIQELESRVSSLSTDKSSVTLQFQNLQAEYENLENEFHAKSRNYEEKLNLQEKQSRLNDENLRNLLDRQKRDHEQQSYELSREFQMKIESLTRQSSSLAVEKESLESEIKSLRSQINHIKAQAEEALKDLEQRLREEEGQKFTSSCRNYEARLQNLEDSRESLAKRLQEMQKDFNSADLKFQEQVRVLENSIVQMREEKSDLTLRLQKISAQKDNLQNDLIVTKNALDRNQAENQELAKALKDRKEAHNNQIERMCHEHSSERRMVENSRDSAVEKSKELEGELNRVRREKEKILRDFEHLNEVLKSKVGLMIQETVIGHMRKVEGE